MSRDSDAYPFHIVRKESQKETREEMMLLIFIFFIVLVTCQQIRDVPMRKGT